MDISKLFDDWSGNGQILEGGKYKKEPVLNRKRFVRAIKQLTEQSEGQNELQVMQKPANKMYDLAIAQFTGYREAQYSNSIIDLVTSMGLTKKEWNKLKKNKDVDFLTLEDKKEIDEHFKQC